MLFLDRELVTYLAIVLIAHLKILISTTAPSKIVHPVHTMKMLVFSVMLIVLKVVSDYSKGVM